MLPGEQMHLRKNFAGKIALALISICLVHVGVFQAEAQTDPKPLGKEEAAKEIARQAKEYASEIRKSRKAEWDAKVIKLDDLEMKFEYRTFGKKPKDGHSLFISMHGGGGAPARVNDRQWNNQIGLYKPAEGIYLAPRAPTNTWNLWHESHIDRFFARIIEDAIAIEGVNPNRVYLMGYSAGGDGVYQLAPRMADQIAAAAMMAGHPNGVSPLGLRNIGFTIHMGGKDAAYKRNKIAAQWKEKLAKLKQEDPDGYEHEVTIHEQHGHWMNRDDAVAVPWMGKFTRRPNPEKVVWHQSGTVHDRFYWLAAEKADQKPGARMIVSRDGNTFVIHEVSKVDHVVIRVNDDMVDFSKPIKVIQHVAGSDDPVEQTFKNVQRSEKIIAKTLAGRGDVNAVYTAEIKVKVSH